MDVTREIELDAPPEEVWEALTDADQLAEWFANDVELDPAVLLHHHRDDAHLHLR
jgi:uncharacterized protein YndB with AHSA1/START domain